MPPTYSETNSKQLLDHLPTIGPPKSTPGFAGKRTRGGRCFTSLQKSWSWSNCVCVRACQLRGGRCDFVWFAFEEIWGGCCLVSLSFRVFRSFDLKKGLVEFHIKIPFCMACIILISMPEKTLNSFIDLRILSHPSKMFGIWVCGNPFRSICTNEISLPHRFGCWLVAHPNDQMTTGGVSSLSQKSLEFCKSVVTLKYL